MRQRVVRFKCSVEMSLDLYAGVERMEGQAAKGPSGKGLTYAGVAIAVVALILSVVAIALPAPKPTAPAPTTRRFVLSADFLNASSRWYPSSFVAYAGDTITFNVTNRAPAQHGFTVDGLNIVDLVNPGQSKEYTAPNVAAGLYRYFCQLHAGHIGGQLLVLSR